MNLWALSGSILALAMYWPLWKQIRSHAVHQNMCAWGLWCALDLVVGASIIAQHGNWLLPIAYFFGSFATVFIIRSAGDLPKWTKFETFISVLVVLSMVVWYLTGSKMATVASTTAMVIGGIPQARDAWREPHKMPLAAYVGYLGANILSTVAGAGWTIEERFYPASASAFCLLLVLLSMRSVPVQTDDV